jgi:hypothetical protein
MKKNVFKCAPLGHGFVESIAPDTLEPVETVSGCVFCGHSVAVTIVAGKVTELLSSIKS